MKYVKQFSIILLITFVGELLHYLIPLPIPASVYGLVLMLIALQTGLVKVDHVKQTAVFLIEIMPVMFIPAGAGLLESWGVLQPIWLPVCIITVGDDRHRHGRHRARDTGHHPGREKEAGKKAGRKRC